MSSKRVGRRLIYWDACIFLCWIKDEPQPEPIKKGIAQTLENAYKKELVIVTSTVTLVEVLQSNLTADQKQRYREVFHHPNLQLIDLDRRVAGEAGIIRETYDTRKFDRLGQVVSGSFMALGDSVQVATALHVNAHEMHTLDGSGKRKRPLDLLSLNGNVAGRRLIIVRPYYVPPPAPLEGPMPESTTGQQMDLLDTVTATNLDANDAKSSAATPNGQSMESTEKESEPQQDVAAEGAPPQPEENRGPS